MKRIAALSALILLLAACEMGPMAITPEDGTIVDTDVVQVTGELPDNAPPGGTIVVNGITGTWVDEDTWTAEIATSPVGYVTVVRSVYTSGSNTWTSVTAVLNGEKIDDGEYSPDGVGMLFTNNGIAGLGPVINDLAGGSFDISALILAQDPLIPPTDAGLGVTITGRAYEAGSSGVSVSATSTAAGVNTTVQVSGLYIGLDLQLSGLISGACKLELQVPTTTIASALDFVPDGDNVDVNLIGSPTVTTTGVSYEFISGVCDPSTPLLGSIIDSQAGSTIEGTIANGFRTQVGDPDGSGPADSPIAEAIETALAEISIAGAVGEAVHANLDAPFTQISETATGIDFRANADFYTTFGTGPSDCLPPAGAPDFTSSFDIPGVYPTLGGTTPAGAAYGLGLTISASAFNQMLSAMTECGLLNQDLTEITVGGQVLPVNSTVLSLLVPEFATRLPANTPLIIRIDPTAAPFITEAPNGPNGEMAELMLANLHVDFIQPGTPAGDLLWLSLAVDAPLGFDLAFDAVNGVLAPTITPPPAGTVTTRVVRNSLETNEANLEVVFSNLFPMFVDGLSSSFAAFPLPSFLGLDLEVIEMARQGNTYVLYSNLNPVLQTRIENVVTTDLSTADFSNDSVLLDSWEWRHRNRSQVSSSGVRLSVDGMIGADACCTVDDERANAHAGGRITFDVIPENGDTWQVDLAHAVAGAHTLKSEGIGGGYGMQSTISTVTGRARIGSGPWQSFNFDPSVRDSGWRSGESNVNYHYPFTGGAGLVLQGTTAQTITVEFGFDIMAFSDSNLLFPAEAGGEAAVRFGANDSLTNNFTAGDYPGVGNRNIVTDGYTVTATLSTVS